MTERIQIDPDGTLWLEIDEQTGRSGDLLTLISGSDPDDPSVEITLSERDLGELTRLYSPDPGYEIGYKIYK